MTGKDKVHIVSTKCPGLDPHADLKDACTRGDQRSVQMLLHHRADVHRKDRTGMALLHHAARKGHEKVVAMLLEYGADADVTHPQVGAPLTVAAYSGYLEIVKILLKAGTATTVDEPQRSSSLVASLAASSQKGRPEIVQILLKASADVHARTSDGGSCLHFACKAGHADVLKVLLEGGADANAANVSASTPLHIAAAAGRTEMAKMLLDFKADAGAKDADGATALDAAVLSREATTIRILPGGDKVIDGEATKDLAAFENASVVHVLATRHHIPDDKDLHHACDPAKAALLIKSWLEEKAERPGAVKVFNANTDNAVIMAGREKEANAIWLLNWRRYLQRAYETGGKVLQILVDIPSPMQEAEEEMAADKGVPLVRIDITHLIGSLDISSTAPQELASAKAFERLLKDLPAKLEGWKPKSKAPVTVMRFTPLQITALDPSKNDLDGEAGSIVSEKEMD